MQLCGGSHLTDHTDIFHKAAFTVTITGAWSEARAAHLNGDRARAP